MSEPVKTPVVQFGTSRFLQAHADLFLSEGAPPVGVTVVQSSGDASRAGRLAALAAPEGYPVRVRGILDGQQLDEERRVTSVKRTLSTATDWDEVTRVVVEEAEFILSNTGDAGYAPRPDDRLPEPSQGQSYPAKLFHLLAARFRAGAAPVTVMPMELVPENGHVLRARVLEIAQDLGVDQALIDWLAGLVWANSLVDRIVSEPLEPAGAVAEPYALWAIEAQPGLQAPTSHSCIQIVPDLEEIERLKLHILNLGHSSLVDIWQRQGANPDTFVRQMMEGESRAELDAILNEEVLPGFAHKGRGDAAQDYIATTMERFMNPFLDHRLSDIAQNHAQKVERRIGAFIAWVGNDGPAMPRLNAIVERA